MSTKMKSTKVTSNFRSIIMFLLCCTCFVLITNAKLGITDETPKDIKLKLQSLQEKGIKKLEDIKSEVAQGVQIPFEFSVKYLATGDIVVSSPDSEKSFKPKNTFKGNGNFPIKHYQTVTFVTVIDNSGISESKGTMGTFIGKIIPAAVASTTHENHYTIIDGEVVACTRHKITSSPASHTRDGTC